MKAKIKKIVTLLAFGSAISQISAEPRIEVATKQGSIALQDTCQWIGKAEEFAITFTTLGTKPMSKALTRARTLNASVVQVIYSYNPMQGDACGARCVVRFWSCP